jgi:hypothetical protein
MNRKARNQRNAIPIMLISGLFLLSFIFILIIFTSASQGTPTMMDQFAIQQTQISMGLTMTALAGGEVVVDPQVITLTPVIQPPPIITVIPTTPVILPPPGGPINFFDNFDNGFSPLWQVTGEWIFTDGKPVFTGRPRCDGRVLTGAVNWDNYAIEFDKLTQGGWYLLFGYKDEQNYFDIYFNPYYSRPSPASTYIDETYNGNKSRINTSERGGISNGKTRLEIHGDRLKFYTIDSYGDISPVYDMQLARPLNGQVGFQTCNGSEPVLDNFKVYSIP